MAFLDGSVVLPLLAGWIAFSCSRWFGLPDVEGLPQVTLDRMLALALVGYALVSAASTRQSLRPWSRSEALLWLVGLVASVSGIVFGGFTSGYFGANVSILFNLLVFPALAYSILLRTRISNGDLTTFCGLLTVFTLYLGCVAILEPTSLAPMLIPPEIGDPSNPHHWGRSRGPFIQAEFNGTVLTQLLPVAVLLLARGQRWWRLLALTVLPLICIGVYLTETRAALLSLVVILLVGSVSARPSRRPYAALAGALAAAGVAVGIAGGVPVPRLGEISPLADRLTLLTVTASMISTHPLLGIGFGNFDLYQDAFFLRPQPFGESSAATLREFWAGGTHNTLLTPFAELGIPFGMLFLGLVLWALHRTWRRLTASSSTGAVATCAWLVGLAFMINALLVELRFTPTPNLLFWSFVAIADARRAEIVPAPARRALTPLVARR